MRRCIVSDEEILNLIKNEKIDSWDSLSKRTGYENLEYLRRRVRRMHYKGMLIMGNRYKCFDVKLIKEFSS